MVWLYLNRRSTLLSDGPKRRLLHVAPEAKLSDLLSHLPNITYVTADLVSSTAAVRLDLTASPFRENVFDVVCCSHVLEHIPDDRLAIREIFRILRPEGWALIAVPVLRDTTFEDPMVDPRERERAFGQHDHVRVYGRDFPERLRAAGFSVNTPTGFVRPEEERYFGLSIGDGLYVCHKLDPEEHRGRST